MNLLFVSIGGAIGAICRYLLGNILTKRYRLSRFPVAILIINIAGSSGLGLFYGSYYGMIPDNAYGDRIYLLLVVGFFGAFTTFSTFSMESIHFIENRQWKMLIAYISLTIIGSVFMFMLMFSLTR